MRTSTTTNSSNGAITKWTFPNPLSYTNSRYQYVMAEMTGTTKDPNGADKIYVRYNGKTTWLQRVFMNNKAIYPLTSVLETLASEAGVTVMRNVELRYKTNNNSDLQITALPIVIVGYSAEEIPEYSESETETIRNGKMVLYPEFIRKYNLPEQSMPVLLGFRDSQLFNLQLAAYNYNRGETWLPVGSSISSRDITTPFFELPLKKYSIPPEYWLGFGVLIGTSPIVRQPVEFDMCTDGVFIKWIDKGAAPRLYRWSLESTDEEADVEETFTCLDETLQPYDVQDRTLTTRYVLHSRMVEQDIYDLCKSIIGGRELFMWNSETLVWEPCYLDDSDAEDYGDILKDLTIEVVKKAYHI